ncbi:von Willebrand factor A domain-containing protein [Cucumis melo var. makuwa]|uniref:von Willebrand factor A domain-containing protein n=1 Tax=Cucumis melo var. makuwa TaxID=1194695 RepID=A0A5D3CEQ5_CUCMM|nr:von Willebrand factor A domain-containing protein [Cucumis melo var. makuwa]
MAEDFAKAVDDGLRLSKRLYFGKDRAVAPPRSFPTMDRMDHSFLPTAPMVYAVIHDPGIVDNPDIPSYQPHVHGRCDPPALIPLQMNAIELQADCYLDTAIIRITGSWRVHCVMGSRSCDCRIAIPMGEQGSVLGCEVDDPRKSHRTSLIALEDKSKNASEKPERLDGGFLTPNIFTLTIPQVDGGTTLSITMTWSQKLLYNSSGDLSLDVPFTFPQYVIPAGKKMAKKEKIVLNMNVGSAVEVLCKTTSHPLKESMRKPGKLSFIYESEVLMWSKSDLSFSYSVSSSQISGGILLQSPPVDDADQREMFCMYLYPGKEKGKVFRKKIVFVVDISGSMQGKALDGVKNVLSTALSKLPPEDMFNIIAFNEDTRQFSESMEMATKDAVDRALQWIEMNFVAGGGTDILLPLTKATEMLNDGGNGGSVPIIFLVTDGAVHNERHICDVMRKNQTEKQSIHPRIYTFGIGTFCNHYFLRMLAMIGRGQYDAAYDVDLVEPQMQKLYKRAASTIFVNIAMDAFDDLDEVKVYPSSIPDLSSESPITVSGRYRGKFPEVVKAKGLLANLDNIVLDLNVQQAKDIPLDKLFAKNQIEQLTAEAWCSENQQLVETVKKMSTKAGVMSEYTQMVIFQNADKVNESIKVQQKKNAYEKMVPPKGDKMMLLPFCGVGFGNLEATSDNTPLGTGERKPEAAEIFVKAASNCCGNLCSFCCCPCCIETCSRMNNQCAILLTQLCTALACFGCFDCCLEMCCDNRSAS